MDPYFKPGDYIVGKYNDMGNQIKAGKVYDAGDDEEAYKIKEMFANHGRSAGGTLLPTAKTSVTQKKKVKKPKLTEKEEPVAPLWESLSKIEPESLDPTPKIEKINKPQQKKYIYLYNKLGKIRLTVESVLECEQAYCLVFYSVDDLIFTPNPGETLTLIIDTNTEVPVYYPNSSFTWIDGEKQLMILFKVDE